VDNPQAAAGVGAVGAAYVAIPALVQLLRKVSPGAMLEGLAGGGVTGVAHGCSGREVAAIGRRDASVHRYGPNATLRPGTPPVVEAIVHESFLRFK